MMTMMMAAKISGFSLYICTTHSMVTHNCMVAVWVLS